MYAAEKLFCGNIAALLYMQGNAAEDG